MLTGEQQQDGNIANDRNIGLQPTCWMIRRIAGTAGPGIARGAVGIGKTYCMTQIGERLKDKGAKVLAKFGCDQGNIRSMAKVYREAEELARDTKPSAADIQDAISMIGGV
ncbi:hypothetical protein ACFMPD_10555 [Sedimentitalea sp. HM32M-2]|uniref:hypothetical protein n=1 Tax=Sedimentitalea sp. HM32M-2 TaxID=3351566 RepID=UPI00364417EC